MRGFVGPNDIFRNPEAIWRQFEPTDGDSPFDLVLSHSGGDFAVMGMHFKLGLYEHQSAGALQGLIDLIQRNPQLLDGPQNIASIKVIAYEPAFGIIGDPAKRDPRTRQSADHSMVYIIATVLGKAMRMAQKIGSTTLADSNDGYWKKLILMPDDYNEQAILDHQTRVLMEKVTFEHGGPEYDAKYPDGIPTSVIITDTDGKTFDSGLVMYPAGHARNTTANLDELLSNKWQTLGALASDDPQAITNRFNDLANLTAADLRSLYDFKILDRERLS
jgi:2-methylcitrate dehydratase